MTDDLQGVQLDTIQKLARYWNERGRSLRPHFINARREGIGDRNARRVGAPARKRVYLRTPSSPIWRKRPKSNLQRRSSPAPEAATTSAEPRHCARRFDTGRLWAYARRETMELLRDPIRLTFALIGPLILMIAFGYGISLDVEHLRFSAFDQDQTPESRSLIEAFTSSPPVL